jgi:hypothetical protein
MDDANLHVVPGPAHAVAAFPYPVNVVCVKRGPAGRFKVVIPLLFP